MSQPMLNELDQLIKMGKRILPENTPETPYAALQFALDWVTVHWKEWNQEHWMKRDLVTHCGTTACLAGTVAALGGYGPKIVFNQFSNLDGSGGEESAEHLSELDSYGWNKEIADRAYELLVVPDHDGHNEEAEFIYNLFSDQNSLADLWEIAYDFSNKSLIVPDSIREGTHPTLSNSRDPFPARSWDNPL